MGRAGRWSGLNGVVAAGLLSDVNVHDMLVSASPVVDPSNQTAFKLAVRAASPDLFRAVRADLASGRFIDGGIRPRRARRDPRPGCRAPPGHRRS